MAVVCMQQCCGSGMPCGGVVAVVCHVVVLWQWYACGGVVAVVCMQQCCGSGMPCGGVVAVVCHVVVLWQWYAMR